MNAWLGVGDSIETFAPRKRQVKLAPCANRAPPAVAWGLQLRFNALAMLIVLKHAVLTREKPAHRIDVGVYFVEISAWKPFQPKMLHSKMQLIYILKREPDGVLKTILDRKPDRYFDRILRMPR